MPQRVSFYDTGGLKYMPRRVSFYDTGGLKYMCLGGLVTTCGVSVWANAGGLDHGEEAPTGVEDLPRLVRPIQAHARTTFEHGQTLGREACVRSSEPFYGPIRIVLGILQMGVCPWRGVCASA